MLERYLQPGQDAAGSLLQQGSEQVDRAAAAAGLTQGMHVDWPAAVLSCTILAVFFLTSTQRILGARCCRLYHVAVVPCLPGPS